MKIEATLNLWIDEEAESSDKEQPQQIDIVKILQGLDLSSLLKAAQPKKGGK